MKLFQLLFCGLAVFFSCTNAGPDVNSSYSFPSDFDYQNSKKISNPCLWLKFQGLSFTKNPSGQ